MSRINKSNKGFTLMELLIVIAIIVILVAISIPIMGGQIVKSNEAADVAAIRSCFFDQQSKLLADETTLSDAIKEVNSLNLQYKNNLSCEGSTITYKATRIENSGSNEFVWVFKTSDY